MILQLIATLALAVNPMEAPPVDLHVEDRGTACLALVVFSEARGEPLVGQLLVGQTVLNRLKDRELGTDPCDVAMEPGQFAGLESWPIPRHPELIDAAAWDFALDIVRSLVLQPDLGPCGHALYFHKILRKTPEQHELCRVGNHVFLGEP